MRASAEPFRVMAKLPLSVKVPLYHQIRDMKDSNERGGGVRRKDGSVSGLKVGDGSRPGGIVGVQVVGSG
jgi:hypothetical protein